MSTEHTNTTRLRQSECSFPGCNKRHMAKGLCDGHWKQRKKGRSLTPLGFQRPKASQPQIIYNEIPCPNPILEGLCHIFCGRLDRDGYGRVSANGKAIFVHRYVWEIANGKIPDGMVIDHMCRNRACCNVKHLRVVTNKQNVTENVVGNAWQVKAAKTHCPQGHPYNEKNTHYAKQYGKGKGGLARMCRACNRERSQARRLKNKRSKNGQ